MHGAGGAFRRSGHSIYKRLSRNEEAKMCLRTHTAKCENILFIIPIKSPEYRRNQGTLLKQYIRSKYKFLCSLQRIGLTLDNINFHSAVENVLHESGMRRFCFSFAASRNGTKIGKFFSGSERNLLLSSLTMPFGPLSSSLGDALGPSCVGAASVLSVSANSTTG